MPVRDLLSAASTQGALPSDPNFEYNTLLLNGDGTNGAQNNTFLDSSTNNFTITRNGNTTQGSFSPYGSNWGNYFNGSSYLRTTSNITLGTTYTFEAWVNFTDLATGSNAENSVFGSGASLGIDFGYGGTTGTRWFMAIYGSGFTVESANTTIQKGVWYHVAWVLSAGTGTIYVNGTSVASGAYLPVSPPTTGISVGSYGTAGAFTGYISNARYVNGTALYTGTFTPPTTPLTAISGTQLLTCQSNRFIDNSSNNYTLSVNGTPQVQRFSPFNPTAPYSTSVIGGSGYFDGSGDDLSIASNSAFHQSGNFTIEYWAYLNANTNYQIAVGRSTDYITIQHSSDSGGMIRIVRYGAAFIGSGGNVIPKQWNHFALVRSGSTVTAYLNGVSVASGSDSTSTATGNALAIGQNSDGSNYFTGYLSDVRITNSAVYTSTFTPPTAPLTAITNTALLTNMVNAGIPDLAMQNNLETVGNAQVSTSVKKYGTGSLAFDGTGDYLSIRDNPIFNLGASNWTIEAWVYPTATGSYPTIAAQYGVSAAEKSFFLGLGNSNTNLEISLYYSSTLTTFSATSALTLNTWQHIAVVRNGNTVTLYVNGSSVTSGSFTQTITDATSPLTIGYSADAGQYPYTGYIDDFRITNGLARYTANFTPPTAALPTY
jgi:hypothetical protein